MRPLQYGVLVDIVRLLLRGYLQHSGHRQQMLVDGGAYHVRIYLIDHYDGDILACHEALKALVYGRGAGVCQAEQQVSV